MLLFLVSRAALLCSADITTGHAVNSILFQRGLYPQETFEKVPVHGTTVLVATHPGLREYLVAVQRQLGRMLPRGYHVLF